MPPIAVFRSVLNGGESAMVYHVTSPLGSDLPGEVLSLLQRQQEAPALLAYASARPLIAVPGLLVTNQNGRWPIFGSDGATMNALRRVGAHPLSLPSMPLLEGDPLSILGDERAFAEAFDTLWSYITRLHIQGVCLPGGGDLYSCLYYQQTGPQTESGTIWLDLWERYLLLIGWLLRWPTFGICRGMQHMNVILGGGLIQDLRAQWRSLWQSDDYEMLPMLRHRPLVRSCTPETFLPHDVYVTPQSMLAQVLQLDGAATAPHILDACLSQHHQAVGVVLPDGTVRGMVAEGLHVEAISSDGVIEALAHQEHLTGSETWKRWYLGVQWHPEWMVNDYWAQELFRGFAQECRAYRPLSPSQLQELEPAVRAWIRQVDETGLTPARRQRLAALTSPSTGGVTPVLTTEPLSESHPARIHRVPGERMTSR